MRSYTEEARKLLEKGGQRDGDELHKIKGHLVKFPKDFLSDEMVCSIKPLLILFVNCFFHSTQNWE